MLQVSFEKYTGKTNGNERSIAKELFETMNELAEDYTNTYEDADNFHFVLWSLSYDFRRGNFETNMWYNSKAGTMAGVVYETMQDFSKENKGYFPPDEWQEAIGWMLDDYAEGLDSEIDKRYSTPA